MELTSERFARVEPYLERRQGRALPKRFGDWYTIHAHMNGWAKAGVLDRLFAQLQRERCIRVKIDAVSLDSTIIEVHPDGAGAPKKQTSSRLRVPQQLEHQ